MTNVLKTPVGGNRRYLVQCRGEAFAGFDTKAQAQSYVAMQKSKTKGAGKEPAYAATCEWTIKDTQG